MLEFEKGFKAPNPYVIKAIYLANNLPYIAKIVIETLYREILPPNTIK